MSEVHSITALSDEAFGWYLTGLTDGEGCFGIYARNFITNDRPNRSRATQWHLSFQIALRADESNHLKAISERMGCGTIRVAKTSSNPRIDWKVCRSTELAEIIIPHFDRFPLQLKKSRDFMIWRPCMMLYRSIVKRSACGVAGKRGAKKWTNAENQFMANSMAELRKTRQYDSQITPVPKDKPTRNGGFPLFPAEMLD